MANGACKLRRTDDIPLVETAWRLCFTGGEEWDPRGLHWVATCNNNLAGFCSVREVDDDIVFLCWSGVLPKYRGQHLQRRMINVRCNWARKLGYSWAITYTMQDNTPSLVNLLRAGFQIYEPQNAWVGRKGILYFRKELKPC